MPLLVVFIFVVLTPGALAATITVGQGQTYTTIQAAVDAAHPGDTILVDSGTYVENAYVDKDNLTIIGYNTGSGMPVIDGYTTESLIVCCSIFVDAPGVRLEGLNVTNADYGIILNSTGDIVENCVACGNAWGIYLYPSTGYNTVTGCTAVGNINDGIFLDKNSHDNRIIGNIVSNNYNGILLDDTNDTVVAGNTVLCNSWGILLTGSDNVGNHNDTVSGNTVTGGSNINDDSVSEDGISLEYVFNGTIANNTLCGNYLGIGVGESSNTVILNNTAVYNSCGIQILGGPRFLGNVNGSDFYVYDYANVSVIGNNVSYNYGSGSGSGYGIDLDSMCSCLVEGNTVVGNGMQGIVVDGTYGYFKLDHGRWVPTPDDNDVWMPVDLYNRIVSNTVANNTVDGIYNSGQTNVYYLNRISGNGYDNLLGIYNNADDNNLWLNGSYNGAYWNSTGPVSYTDCNGLQHVGYAGNYWGDYTGADGNGDGIGDTPYTVEAGSANGYDYQFIDYYPMVSQADNHTSYTLSLKRGWNLVSSPLVVDPAVNVSVFKGTNVTMVARYNKTTGGFDIYRVGKTPVAFQFVESLGYFLYCGNDTTYMVNGFAQSGQSTAISQGWNLVGWTNMTSSNSKALSQGLHNVTMLARYNTTSGSYDIYRVGKTPTPFAIQAGEGYFLYTTYASQQTMLMG